MALELADYEKKARDAIKAFWGNREKARQKQIAAGKIDQGERAGVTSGKNLDGFFALIEDLVRANGMDQAQIHLARSLVTLPGYFRPTKLWDMLIVNQGKLVAALEFKSQVGPSFGNNFNTRFGKFSPFFFFAGTYTFKNPGSTSISTGIYGPLFPSIFVGNGTFSKSSMYAFFTFKIVTYLDV